MPAYIPIPGTHAYDGSPEPSDWYHPQSALSRYFADTFGLTQVSPDDPWCWTTDLDGFRIWRRLRRKTSLGMDWLVAGKTFRQWVSHNGCSGGGVPMTDRNVICHSHGLQPILYACAEGLKLRALISVSSPVRSDLLENGIASAAAKNIGHWTHVHSDRSDRWQWLGTLADGMLGITRAHPLAHRNVAIAHVGHSKMLNEASRFHLWRDERLLDGLLAVEGDSVAADQHVVQSHD